MQLVFLLALLWGHARTPAWGYGTGAPTSVCGTMLPGHGVTAQTAASPFTILTNITGTFRTNQSFTVTINGSDYTGVLLQARTGTGTGALGTWGAPPSNTQMLTCSANSKGAITHANENIKNGQTVYTWTASSVGDSVFFVATVAKSKSVYWVNVKSATLSRATGDPVTPGAAADLKLSGVLLLPVLLLSLFLS